ncbi:hypothetical protein J6590_049247 [Homalodisca vitripennis]|nr:hypothetical protein J6590_049247 [Homalodisca vitripennis]
MFRSLFASDNPKDESHKASSHTTIVGEMEVETCCAVIRNFMDITCLTPLCLHEMGRLVSLPGFEDLSPVKRHDQPAETRYWCATGRHRSGCGNSEVKAERNGSDYLNQTEDVRVAPNVSLAKQPCFLMCGSITTDLPYRYNSLKSPIKELVVQLLDGCYLFDDRTGAQRREKREIGVPRVFRLSDAPRHGVGTVPPRHRSGLFCVVPAVSYRSAEERWNLYLNCT